MSKPRKVVSVKDLRDGLASNHTSVLHFFESLDSNKDGALEGHLYVYSANEGAQLHTYPRYMYGDFDPSKKDASPPPPPP